MQVHQILKDKSDDGVVTVAPETPVSAAVETLSNRRIGALIVSTDGKVPMGILSERDIVREIGRRGTGCLGAPVAALMTRDPVTCARQDTADAVLAQMTRGRFRHMPVLEAGQMVGLISIGDVVKARLSELAFEKEALQDMIMGH